MKDTMNEKRAPALNPARMHNSMNRIAFIRSSVWTRRSSEDYSFGIFNRQALSW